MTFRILNAEPGYYSADARSVLLSLGEVVEEQVAQEELASRVADVDALIVRLRLRVTREVIESGRRLKAVVSATTGLDHIDSAAARAKGVAVLSLQGETDFLRAIPASAEHTWALLLALMRRIPWAYESVQTGEWNRDAFRGHDLRGQRLGILGLGRIGQQVTRFGLAFGMAVGAYDPYRAEWSEGVNRFESLGDLLSWSNVLAVCLPLNEETKGLLDEANLHRLPAHAIIINTARGGIIDEDALVRALADGHLAGAAVDVLAEEEPSCRRVQSPLLPYARSHTNLLVTPHLAGATWESMARTELFMAKKLEKFLEALHDQ